MLKSVRSPSGTHCLNMVYELFISNEVSNGWIISILLVAITHRWEFHPDGF